LISSVPRIPGMTITGRFPVLDRAAAKICSRLGLRRAEMHALETSDSARRVSTKCRELANRGLFNWHRPATINETRDKPCAKSVVDIYHRHIGSTGVQHTKKRRDTSKRCSISDAGWYSHDGHAY
jgi:hypothetical protein